MAFMAPIAYLIVIALIVVIARWTCTHEEPNQDIVFKNPRTLMPAERLAEFRRRKCLADPQRVEGNDHVWNFPKTSPKIAGMKNVEATVPRLRIMK